MGHKIFISLPVKDLPASRAFWEALGYHFSKQFSDDTAACLVITDDIYVMIQTHAKFGEFVAKPIIDATKSTEAIFTLSCDSKEDVHRLADAALKAGGKEASPPDDYGFMFSRNFHDLDGHNWNLVYMDPSYVQPQ